MTLQTRLVTTEINTDTIWQVSDILCVGAMVYISFRLDRQRLNDCSMKHYIVLNMALFSHAHVTINAEIKLRHACSRSDVSHERTAAA